MAGALILIHWREATETPVTSWTQDSTADCAIALTGGVGRIHEGISLLSRKLVKKLIVSGVYPEVQVQDLYPASLLMGDVNEADIILERRSQTTYGNAQQSLPLVEVLGCRDIVLVTSQLHMHRAFATFRHVFPEEMKIIKHSIPRSHAEDNWLETLIEALKIQFYSLWAY